MNKITRQQQIVNLLSTKDFLSVNELADVFSTTNMTIRRDLDELEAAGGVRRIHGGAVAIKTENVLPTFSERVERSRIEKKAIGKAAFNLITPGSVVCLDGSTTALEIIKNFTEDTRFTVITTGIMTACECCRYPNIEIIQVGGIVHHSSYTSCSSLATEFLKHFNADYVFFSTRAVNPLKGTVESSMDLVEEKRALIGISRKVVLLADHTKFEANSLYQSIPIERIDTVITDKGTSSEAIEQMEGLGIELEIVPSE